MTMVPAAQDQQRRNLFHGGGGCGGGYDEGFVLGSDFLVANRSFSSMAEDESRTNSINNSTSKDSKNQEINENISATNNNKEQEIRDESWLQLGLGQNPNPNSNSNSRTRTRNNDGFTNIVDPTVDIARRGLIELDLLPGNASSASSRPVFNVPPPPVMTLAVDPAAGGGPGGFSGSFFFQQQPQEAQHWGLRPLQMQYPPATVSSSGFLPLGPYFSRPFNAGVDTSAAGPSYVPDFRVVDPPRRPSSGIWFTLQASQNQAQEPFLPQISKSYLRIKDGRMTVRLLIKYLVNKLRLDSESEVEITCRGQQLLPLLTLQHVRDNIWKPRESVTLLADSSTTDHIMVLNYGRISLNSQFQN